MGVGERWIKERFRVSLSHAPSGVELTEAVILTWAAGKRVKVER